MCGRYIRKADKERMIRKFELVDGLDYFEVYEPSNEVFPGTPIMAINKDHKPEDIWWTIRDRRWGGGFAETINAKAETIQKVPMFREAFHNDRVLIPATGLYEWHTLPDKKKVKYEITFDEPLFAFAGIARDCEIKGETKRCGVIVTTHPNDIFKEVHNTKQRQAVVIREADYDKWLDPKTPVEELKEMLEPLPNEQTHAERVK